MRGWIAAGLAAFLASFMMSTAQSTAVPSNPRSAEVIARVTPVLTPQLEKKNLKMGSPVYLRIFKSSSELEVWVKGPTEYQHFKTYSICYFSGKLGPKTREGDLQSPEGFYSVTPERLKPDSRFHLGLLLNYPNRFDQLLGRTGGSIVIHGDCVSIGCFAMTDPAIEEIYTLAATALERGQAAVQVHVFPFRMTQENLAHAGVIPAGDGGAPQESGTLRNSPGRPVWAGFWANLREGYDWFERNHRPPNVAVASRRYVFSE
jgi:murein L,D-transpeptidase YafK